MLDKILGLSAIAIFIAYFGVLMGFVPDIDLIAVLSVVVVMACYDFYISLFKRRNGR